MSTDDTVEVVLYEIPSGMFCFMQPDLWAYMLEHNLVEKAKYTFIAQGHIDAMSTLARLRNTPTF